MLNIGLKLIKEYPVNVNLSALEIGSGDLLVLSTPSLLAFMENCAKELVKSFLNEGDTTVGIEVNMKHLSPTKLDDVVIVEAELVNIEGRILSFKLIAKDSRNIIANMEHKRCIVNKEKFMSKVK